MESVFDSMQYRWISTLLNETPSYYTARWPNTGFASALADAIQRTYKNKHAIDTATILIAQCILRCLLFFATEHSMLMVLVFYYKGMLEKV